MEGQSAIAIVALVVTLMPVLILGLVIAAFVGIIYLFFGLLSILDKPVICWFYYIFVAFDWLVLIPLGLVCVVAKYVEPELLERAWVSVVVFAGVLLVPTFLLNAICQKTHAKENERRERNKRA